MSFNNFWMFRHYASDDEDGISNNDRRNEPLAAILWIALIWRPAFVVESQCNTMLFADNIASPACISLRTSSSQAIFSTDCLVGIFERCLPLISLNMSLITFSTSAVKTCLKRQEYVHILTEPLYNKMGFVLSTLSLLCTNSSSAFPRLCITTASCSALSSLWQITSFVFSSASCFPLL